MIPAKKRIYGLIGYPVKHSLSPLMHNAAFKHLKINAEYKLFPLKENEIEYFIKGLKKKYIYGLNVTVPYKEKIIPFLDNTSKKAELIGAVNTIRFRKGRLEGFNTDGEGFIKHLKESLKFNPRNKTVAIIGAGGAAKAVAAYLAKSKPKLLSVYDIDKTKLRALVNHLKDNFRGINIKAVNSISGLNVGSSDLLINTTPVGMKDSDPCLVDKKFLHKNILVYDLIYNPKETRLLKIAKEAGARTANGLGMLLYQGARAFELWTSKPAPVRIMRAALNKGAYKK